MVRDIENRIKLLCDTHYDEWTKAIKDGKMIIGVKEQFKTYTTIISWYDEEWNRCAIEIKEHKTEHGAIRLGKEIKVLIYKRLNLDTYLK